MKFFDVNPAIYSEMWRDWDELAPRVRMNLVVTGSVNTLMNKIFKKQPLFEQTTNKFCRYRLNDNFFRFWFRFVFRYQYLIQVRMFAQLRGLVEREDEVFPGHALEGYFRQKFIEEGRYSRMGGWWNRKGEKEIDLVCENEFEHRLDF